MLTEEMIVVGGGEIGEIFQLADESELVIGFFLHWVSSGNWNGLIPSFSLWNLVKIREVLREEVILPS